MVDLEADTARALYRRMAEIRRFEEVAQALFRRGAIMGSIHLCIGQEAVPVGVCSALEADDVVAATYRGHGAALALGVDPLGLMAELLHKRTGICGGRAGSMNVVDRTRGLLGCFGIVGGSIATATGAGLSLRQRGSGAAVAFFGDGAVNQAYFSECLNFATVMRLPVVFVCENNLYGEFTPMAAVTPGGIPARPQALGLPTHSVDGNDVVAVRRVAAQALEHARAGRGPAFVEALTYRLNDHARGDPIDYRPAGEMDAWKVRDPLLLMRTRLIDEYAVPEAELDLVLADVQAEMEAVRAAALEAPFPDPREQGSEFR